MPIRRTRVFGERQYIRLIQGSVYRFHIVKVLLEIEFEGSTFIYTIKITRKINVATQQVISSSTVTGSFVQGNLILFFEQILNFLENTNIFVSVFKRCWGEYTL